jgi:hypothetical protein
VTFGGWLTMPAAYHTVESAVTIHGDTRYAVELVRQR